MKKNISRLSLTHWIQRLRLMLWPSHSHRRLVNIHSKAKVSRFWILIGTPIRSDPPPPPQKLILCNRWASSYSITPSTVFSTFLCKSPNLLYLYYTRIEWLLMNFQFCFVCFWWFWLMGFAYFFLIIVLCFLRPWKSFKFLVLMNVCIYGWTYSSKGCVFSMTCLKIMWPCGGEVLVCNELVFANFVCITVV